MFFFFFSFFFYSYGAHRDLHSFPTRRSSDLVVGLAVLATVFGLALLVNIFQRKQEARNPFFRVVELTDDTVDPADRMSTRLNSSHSQISYAVFCLKKKK